MTLPIRYAAGLLLLGSHAAGAIPPPLPPEQSMAKLVLSPGMEVSLFASEPQLTKVIAGAFDARGRFWAVESPDYPNDRAFNPDNTVNPFGGRDKLTICEDTDGDHKADKFTTFVDKLNMPSTVAFGAGGVLVGMPPYIVLFKDANGDDRADDPRGQVLYQGFGTWDTHIGMSNLRYGPDNWLWGTSGWAAGRVSGVDMYQTVFRARFDGKAMERVANSTNNLWGLGFNEFGQPFHSTANNTHSLATVIPNRHFAKVGQEPKPSVDPTIGDFNCGKHTSNRIFPATTDVTQVDFKGGYTSATSHEFYTARLFPKEYWNTAAFVNEAAGHLVHRCWIKPKGTAFEGTAPAGAENNLLASTDPWTAPVATLVGPDGAVWVVDWYNYVIQHNGFIAGQVIGKGNAYENPDRDKTRSRIYRVYPKGAAFPARLDLARAAPSARVQALRSDNMFWRMTAQRLLVEAADPAVLADLARLAADRSADSLGLNVGAQHALWTMDGLGAFAASNGPWVPTALAALGHPARGVRLAALDVVPRTVAGLEALRAHNLLNDPDPQVRLKALLAVSDFAKGSQPSSGRLEMYAPYAAFDAVTDTAFQIAASRVAIARVDALPTVLRGSAPAGKAWLDRTLYLDRQGRLIPGQGIDPARGSLILHAADGREAGRWPAGADRLPPHVALGPLLYRFEGPEGVSRGWLMTMP